MHVCMCTHTQEQQYSKAAGESSSPSCLQVPQQPMTIFQQIPGIMSPLAQPIRSGHVWEDLIELMMIQNAQMHQVIMNNLTMSALTSFGLSPAPPTAQKNLLPLQIEEDETDLVFHHHYPPYPSISPIPPWQLPAQPPARPQKHPSVRHLSLDQHPASVGRNRNELAVPPPPPPSATGTVGADIPPASEYYDFTEGKL